MRGELFYLLKILSLATQAYICDSMYQWIEFETEYAYYCWTLITGSSSVQEQEMT